MPLSQSTTQQQDRQILQGISKDLQTMTTLFLGGSAYSPGSLAALVQSRIDAANAVGTAKAQWLAAVKTYQDLDAEVTVVVRDLRYLVMAAFGPTSPELADFGFVPAKSGKPTPPAVVTPARRKRRRREQARAKTRKTAER